MDHPLLVFDGNTGHLITAILRPGTVHASGVVIIVQRRLIRLVRTHWPARAIELHTDSGCAFPQIYRFCEEHAITDTIGLAMHARLKPLAADLLAAAIVH